ncbi:hypothetical protein NW754_016320 [Fusarium falciforme]|uniref:Uncharacterized protein n=1 Tax=Fusarium falciforme TaxID=195108 RepID=A0A9W8R3V3_9HYPO|nr:hypothetical protein NW754_016320 [Fusarium falciforme]KAJ4184653.1 hypothetical protein NW755_009106 [Fusarium falciforme]KAJ4246644.1 hypothetical protein NW757_009235 [Fusarium falciforme]
MSANEKRKFASADEMQEHVNDLVASGAIVLGDGKRLKVGDDGLLQVTDPDQNPIPMSSCSPRKRLINTVNYLESPDGPKSAGWCKALAKLHQMLEKSDVHGIRLDSRVWDACKSANDEATDDIAYMDILYHRLRYGGMVNEWIDNDYEFYQFPQRACRLLGIENLDSFGWQVWDDGLADQMLEKDLGAYRLIQRGFHYIQETRASEMDCGDHSADKKASKYVKLFRKLESVKAIDAVAETEEFLILERKGKTAKRVQEAKQARKAEATRVKSEGACSD